MILSDKTLLNLTVWQTHSWCLLWSAVFMMLVFIWAQRSHAFSGIPGGLFNDKCHISWLQDVWLSSFAICLHLVRVHSVFHFFSVPYLLLFLRVWMELLVLSVMLFFFLPFLLLFFRLWMELLVLFVKPFFFPNGADIFFRNSSISRYSDSEASYYKSDSQLDVVDEYQSDNSSLEVSTEVGIH